MLTLGAMWRRAVWTAVCVLAGCGGRNEVNPAPALFADFLFVGKKGEEYRYRHSLPYDAAAMGAVELPKRLRGLGFQVEEAPQIWDSSGFTQLPEGGPLYSIRASHGRCTVFIKRELNKAAVQGWFTWVKEKWEVTDFVVRFSGKCPDRL